MGKKNSTASLLPLTQSLRKASAALERHIYRKNQSAIKNTLINAQIPPRLTNLGLDLIRQVNRQAQIRQQKERSEDSEELRRNIKEKQRISSEFQERLQASQQSYEHCMHIFKGGSLRKKFKHLLPNANNAEDETEEEVGLTEQEEMVLVKLKTLFRRYRVSNMFRAQVYKKLGKKYVQRLIAKGILKEHIGKQERSILSLIC